MVTIFGVLAVFSGVILIYLYDNTLTQAMPHWVYYYLVFTLLLFQTADAVDGKHARNTGRSSPLGQLIDHGLDILSETFLLIFFIAGHRLGGKWIVVIYQLLYYVC